MSKSALYDAPRHGQAVSDPVSLLVVERRLSGMDTGAKIWESC